MTQPAILAKIDAWYLLALPELLLKLEQYKGSTGYYKQVDDIFTESTFPTVSVGGQFSGKIIEYRNQKDQYVGFRIAFSYVATEGKEEWQKEFVHGAEKSKDIPEWFNIYEI